MITRRGFLGFGVMGLRSATAALAAPAAPATHPAEIVILRHAEKPTPKDVHLSERGLQRAAALPSLFPARLAVPQILIAARQSKHSNHAHETLAPLADALHLPIDEHLPDGKYRELARRLLSDARYEGMHVCICWHHETIPQLASALGARGAPSKWHDKVFDQVWRLRYQDDRVRFDVVSQHLLPGDRAGD